MATEEQKKKTVQKRLNPVTNPEPQDDPKKQRPRVSIYWIYGVIFAAIIGYNLYNHTAANGFEIENTQFFTMLKQGDVDQIKTVGNKKLSGFLLIPMPCKITLHFIKLFLGQIMKQQ